MTSHFTSNSFHIMLGLSLYIKCNDCRLLQGGSREDFGLCFEVESLLAVMWKSAELMKQFLTVYQFCWVRLMNREPL